MIQFLQQLCETGDVVVPRQYARDTDATSRLLIVLERVWRADWPGVAPHFHVELAEQAAAVLLVLCQAVVYRELDETQVAQQLQDIGLVPQDSPVAHYSVDLVLRFLPQVQSRLQRTSHDDPLLEIVRTIGRQWPLSAVGIPDCVPDALPAAFQDAGLFQMYVDRIVAADDKARSALPAVQEAIELAWGPFSAAAATMPQDQA